MPSAWAMSCCWDRTLDVMKSGKISVLFRGPPLVITRTSVNEFRLKRIESSAATTRTARRPGSVTCRNRCQALAPSTAAAS